MYFTAFSKTFTNKTRVTTQIRKTNLKSKTNGLCVSLGITLTNWPNSSSLNQISCTSCDSTISQGFFFFPVNERTYFLFSVLQFPGHFWKTNSGQRKVGMTDRVNLSATPFVKTAPSRWWGKKKKIPLWPWQGFRQGVCMREKERKKGRKKENHERQSLEVWWQRWQSLGPLGRGAVAPPTSYSLENTLSEPLM